MDYKSVQFKQEDVEGRVFRGYASTWDLDRGGDIILPGAFTKTLAERGDRVKVLWQHEEPIGKPKLMREDDKGLFVEAVISKTRLGDEAIELMRDGVIDTMSIGYSVPSGKADYDDSGVRKISELKLYEFSAVTFPMNEAAIIVGVKTIRDALRMGREIDQETKAMLEETLALLKALSSTEPVATTQPQKQPPEVGDLMQALKHFGR